MHARTHTHTHTLCDGESKGVTMQMYLRISGCSQQRKGSDVTELTKAMVESMCSLSFDSYMLYEYLSNCLEWVIESGPTNRESLQLKTLCAL